MRFLATGDFHGNAKAVERLAEKAEKENVDLVVITGDMVHFDQMAKGIIKPFKDKGKDVVFITGNHDSDATSEMIAEKYSIRNLQFYAAMIGDVGFFGCGSSNIVGMNYMSEKDMMRYLKKGFDMIKNAKKKVMVTHIHPSDTLFEKVFRFPGSKSITEFIKNYQPDMHLCGHIHEAEGFEETIGKTKMMSVGINGKIIDI